MKTGRTILAWCVLPIAYAGCGGGSNEIVDPGTTQMTLTASPTNAEAGQAVTFTTTASNSQQALTASSIDFEDDGIWDDTRSHNQAAITTTNSHAYPSAGTYTARAEVVDAGQTATTRTTQVTVTTPVLQPVTFTVSGGSTTPFGACYADGSPYTCVNCWFPLSGAGNPKPLGEYAHGATIAFQQGFRQDRFVADTSTVAYSCNFNVFLYSGPPGLEVRFGGGHCTTSSSETVDDPATRVCTIDASGVVP